jgi:endonuclease/exonuclease/phosphatase family metal-dependent hydrolase
MQVLHRRHVWRPLSALVALTVFLAVTSGCGLEEHLGDKDKGDTSQADSRSEQSTTPGSSSAARPAADGETVTVASFNIQVFGNSKSEKPQVMEVLAAVARRFDVVAIQEVRSTSDQIIPAFVELVNSQGANYQYVVGPRLGRTTSKEQYAFVYDADRVELVQGSVYTPTDPQDMLHREPLVASFVVRATSASGAAGAPFRFTLVNIHTDPDETDQELDELDDVYVAVQQETREDDVILLGDLNVDENHLGELGQLPDIGWVVSGVPTNTRGNKTYDNLVYDRRRTVEFTGRWGVLDLQAEYGLTLEQALEVSDHQPVWAEFSRQEGGGSSVAARPGTMR